MGVQKNHLIEMVLLSTHNIYASAEKQENSDLKTFHYGYLANSEDPDEMPNNVNFIISEQLTMISIKIKKFLPVTP